VAKKARKKRKKAKTRKGGTAALSQDTATYDESVAPASQESQLADEEPMDGLRRLFRVSDWMVGLDEQLVGEGCSG